MLLVLLMPAELHERLVNAPVILPVSIAFFSLQALQAVLEGRADSQGHSGSICPQQVTYARHARFEKALWCSCPSTELWMIWEKPRQC